MPRLPSVGIKQARERKGIRRILSRHLALAAFFPLGFNCFHIPVIQWLFEGSPRLHAAITLAIDAIARADWAETPSSAGREAEAKKPNLIPPPGTEAIARLFDPAQSWIVSKMVFE